MEPWSANPAFRTYAACSAILVLKMIFSAVYTGTRRQQTGGFANNEDARMFGKPGATACDTPEVAHALRIQRNDLESIPAFFAIALIYVMSGASAFGAAVYFWTFTIARVVHTVAYMRHLQPWRALSFIVAALCLAGMAVQVLMGVG